MKFQSNGLISFALICSTSKSILSFKHSILILSNFFDDQILNFALINPVQFASVYSLIIVVQFRVFTIHIFWIPKFSNSLRTKCGDNQMKDVFHLDMQSFF